ncbi:NYN domain-containing protein [uncultured Roseovarius sp.]|uniref:NYN domain-containing protein n=1 Tax=uncultured Roseovarius sp. TaxID=293344 RepID=UPI000C3F658A|nr:NYN domain-containing protein [Roseovarius sp.]MBD12686.1 NYN domain-containing protein [Roseovarius sp.]|tara:strand:+ start:2191 stop:2919 length:729 start_codon:yes stop_codon:yes gene_type:complete
MSTLPPTRLSPAPRLSVFVDAENIPVTHARSILDLARRYGDPDLLRAYGNVSLLPDWDKVAGFQFVHSGSGKNATDMLICVDAMERALSDQCAAVLLASSDQDFTHLATRLRGYGLAVIGVGEAKTSERFRAACSEFHELVSIPACVTPAPEPAGQRSTDAPTDLDHKIRIVIRSHCTDNSGYEINLLSVHMHKLHGVMISKSPEKSWRAYLAKRPALYSLDPKGPKAKVRYRPDAFKTVTA